VAFVGAGEFSPGSFASTVGQETERALAPDQMIVLARSDQAEGIRIAFEQSREMKTVRSRFHRSAIELQSYDANAALVGRQLLHVGDGRTVDVALDEILRRGVTAIFRDRGGFVEANASYHFANPSGRHTDRFMRLSNILVRNAEIHFLAVAVMKHITPSATRAYIDTPSLYAVISAVNEQWRALDPTRVALMADNFRSYEGLENYPFENFERSIAVVSASSSGGLAERLETKGFAAEQIVHVLYLGPEDADLKVAADLRMDPHCNPLGYNGDREIYSAAECRLCARGSKFVPLLGDQFDIRGPQPEALVMRQSHAPKALDATMSRLSGSGTFGISTSEREYQADPVEMLKAPGFLERLDFHARAAVPGTAAFCVVPDETSRKFAEHVLRVSRSAARIITRSQIDTEMKDEGNSLAPVLVCAAVIGEGRVLLEISRDLRQVCKKAQIVYLAGFAKPTSAGRRGTLEKNLVQSHHHLNHVVHVVEEMILPGQGFPNAWEEELQFLTSTKDLWPEDARSELQQRLNRLRNSAKSLNDDLFLSNASGRAMKLQPGFAFWKKFHDNSQADVFFTMSAIMQHLRDETVKARDEVLRTNWLQQTLLSSENFGRFNDGVIQACILRGALSAELDYRDDPAMSSDAARIIRRILEAADHSRGEAAVEFLLAIGTGRLRLREQDLELVLRPLPTTLPLVLALRDLIQQRRAESAAVEAGGGGAQSEPGVGQVA
jgi:hypothetical protein